MTVYTDYAFYTEEYLHGREAVVDAASFDFYAFKATYVIKQYTLDNILDNIPECVKMCCCEIAELLFNYDNGSASSGVTSEKVGDISKGYESSQAMKQKLDNSIKSAVYSWLSDTDLLYRGVY